MQLHKREQQEQVQELAGLVPLGPELVRLEPALSEQVLPGQVLEQSELVLQEPAQLVLEQLELEQ